MIRVGSGSVVTAFSQKVGIGGIRKMRAGLVVIESERERDKNPERDRVTWGNKGGTF